MCGDKALIEYFFFLIRKSFFKPSFKSSGPGCAAILKI